MEKYVRKAVLDDALELAPKMRKLDRQEIQASHGVTPLKALVLPFTYEKHKTFTILGTEQEGVIGMFGSTPSEQDPQYGVAWLLSSEQLFNHTRQFLKECPKWVEEMGKGYKFLYNFVDERNWQSLKWLQFLGFEPRKKLPYGVENKDFIFVIKEMNNV
jgi:hypothetical protein